MTSQYVELCLLDFGSRAEEALGRNDGRDFGPEYVVQDDRNALSLSDNRKRFKQGANAHHGWQRRCSGVAVMQKEEEVLCFVYWH